MRSVRWLALAAAVGAALGCRDDEKGPRYEDPLVFCQDLRSAWAEAEVRCEGFTEKAAAWALERVVNCERIAAAIAAGRIRYDAAKAEACVDSFAGVTCDDFGWNEGPNELCTEAVVGRQPAGASCTPDIDLECADGWCDFVDGCFVQGVCRAYRHAGQSCTGEDEECAPDLSCSGSCFTPTTLGVGGNCGVSGVRCGPGLFCETGEMSFTCAPRRGAESSCAYDEQCQGGLQCLAEVCAPWVATGSSCVAGTYACRIGASCSAEGACVAWPGLGGACGADLPEEDLCLEGWCMTGSAAAAGTCVAHLAPGAACGPAGPNPCGPGYACKGGELPVCAPYYCGSLKS